MAVFSLISHLTAGLASGNRKYDITALTFRNVGMSGCLFTLLERNRDREQAGWTPQITHYSRVFLTPETKWVTQLQLTSCEIITFKRTQA